MKKKERMPRTFLNKYAWIFLMLLLTLIPGLLFHYYDPFFYFPGGEHVSTLIFFSLVGALAFLAIKSTDFKFSKLGFDFSHIWKDILFAILSLIVIFAISFMAVGLIEKYVPENIKNFALDPHENFKTKVISGTSEPSLMEGGIPKLLDLIILFILLVISLSIEEIAKFFIFIKTEISCWKLAGFIVSALFFGFWHLTKSGSSAMSAFIGAILLNSLWLMRKRRIVAPIIAHVLYNFLPELLQFL